MRPTHADVPAQVEQYCYTPAGTGNQLCFGVREDAEAAMRSDPVLAGNGQYLERFSSLPSPATADSAGSVVDTYQIKNRKYARAYLMYASSIDTVGEGGFGCTTPTQDPGTDHVGWCSNESELITATVQKLAATKLANCTIGATTLFYDGSTQPYYDFSEPDAANAQRGIVSSGNGYGADYRMYSTKASCPSSSGGAPSDVSVTWKLLRHKTYYCQNGFVAASLSHSDDSDYCETSGARYVFMSASVCQVCSAPPGDGSGQDDCQPTTGDKVLSEVDFEFAGRPFARYYHSRGQFRGSPDFAESWMHSYTDRITGITGAPALVAVGEQGYYETYLQAGGATGTRYRGMNNSNNVVESVTGGDISWRWRIDGGEVREFDSDGRLVAVKNPNDPAHDVTIAYDNGVISTITDRQGRVLRFVYADQMLARILKPDGTAINYGYDSNHNLISVDYGNNQVKRYQYTEFGRSIDKFVHHLTGISSETGEPFAAFTYDNAGKITSSRILGTPNSVTTTSYDSTTQSTLITATGNQRVYTYQLGGARHITSINSIGEGTDAQSFDPQGRLQSRTGKDNVVTLFDYDQTSGYLATMTEAAGTPLQRRHEVTRDPSSNLVTLRRTLDASSAVLAKTAISYNARGQVLKVDALDPGSTAVRSVSSSYCEQADVDAGRCPIVGLLMAIDGPRADVSDVAKLTYRMADDPSCATAPTNCAYRKGDVWKIANALGQTREVLKYDGAGRALSIKDINGVTTDVEYNARGWMTATKVRGNDDTVETDDRISRVEYDNSGQITRTIDADGTIVRYTYDAAHRLMSVIDANGGVVVWSRNGAGEAVKDEVKDSAGTVQRSLSRVYDTFGRVQAVVDAYQKSTSYEYDTAGRLAASTDPLLHRNSQVYDALGRLKETLGDANGIAAKTQYNYDALDRVTKIVDPNGLATTYAYNGFGDVTALNSPDTGQTTSTFDAAGNLASRTDARGITSTYVYDALNRLTAVRFPDSSRNVGYTYDQTSADCGVGENFGKGRMTVIADSSGSTALCYDRYGNPSRKVQWTQGRSYVLRYLNTDPRGRLPGQDYSVRIPPPGNQMIGMVYPDGTTLRISRNAKGQPRDLKITFSNGVSQTLLDSAVYYSFGQAAQWRFGNGRVINRTQNQNGQPGIVQDVRAGGISLGYEFDAASNLKVLRNGNQTDPAMRRYSYDGLNRLTETRDGAGVSVLQSYLYNATGDRTGGTSGGISQAYSYAANSHRMTGVNAEVRSYDAMGNTTSIGSSAQPAPPGGCDGCDTAPSPGDPGPGDPPPGGTQSTDGVQSDASPLANVVREFAYDDAGRMRQVKRDGVVAMDYLYNGKGERVYRSGSGQSVTTLYDESGRWIGDYNNVTGSPIQQAIWMDDLPVGLLVGAGTNQKLYYVEADALGAPRVVVDPVRDVAIWRWDLTGEAFGKDVPNEDPDADGIAFTFDMRFPGQRFDVASGLNYNYFRDYDAATGRYLESDPIGLAGGIGIYLYVNARPLTNEDPQGLADLVFFNPSDGLYLAATRFDIPGMITVMGHAGNFGIRDNRNAKVGPLLDFESLSSSISGLHQQDKWIFLGGCSLGGGDIPGQLARRFNANVISTAGYVMGPSTEKGWNGNGEFSYSASSSLDGRGPPVPFTVTTPNGVMPGGILRITLLSNGRVRFTPFPASN